MHSLYRFFAPVIFPDHYGKKDYIKALIAVIAIDSIILFLIIKALIN